MMLPLFAGVEILFWWWLDSAVYRGPIPDGHIANPLWTFFEHWWYRSDYGLGLQTFLLWFHVAMVVLLWWRWRLMRQRNGLATWTYLGYALLFGAFQVLVIRFEAGIAKISLIQIHP